MKDALIFNDFAPVSMRQKNGALYSVSTVLLRLSENKPLTSRISGKKFATPGAADDWDAPIAPADLGDLKQPTRIRAWFCSLTWHSSQATGSEPGMFLRQIPTEACQTLCRCGSRLGRHGEGLRAEECVAALGFVLGLLLMHQFSRHALGQGCPQWHGTMFGLNLVFTHTSSVYFFPESAGTAKGSCVLFLAPMGACARRIRCLWSPVVLRPGLLSGLPHGLPPAWTPCSLPS